MRLVNQGSLDVTVLSETLQLLQLPHGAVTEKFPDLPAELRVVKAMRNYIWVYAFLADHSGRAV
jgi:hypothetical protein